ncbi:nucleoid-associated protein YejK [Celerinatantimonas sp. MCCC 1A17872]|uniref:nucleoid-associated protein YejK n=1 Tax=Celerinatantimonas sp. MCCC 1A17872 TaxID=3177514 RepID=UPI0038C1CFB2
MSLSLKHLVLHSIGLNEQGEVSLNLRSQEPAVTDNALELIENLHLTYNSKPSKGFGYFADPEARLPAQLQQFLSLEQEFIPFSGELAKELVDRINHYELTEQGILLIAYYEFIGSDYLQIMLLQDKAAPAVNEQMEITASHYLETSSIQLAARIDITEMQRNSESKRYVSFIRGRAGRKVADFFVDFLSCEEGLDVKQQNAMLMSAVDEFCDVANLDAQEKTEYRSQVKSYCDQQLKDGEEIQVKELSARLPSNEGPAGDFYSYAAQNFPIEEQFPADRSSLKKLTKYFGQGKGMTISFDQALLGERVTYDPQTDTLTVVGLPPNLKEQLRRATGGSETNE